ncbi:predicted protein [Uncinocarpus reesii 1704]|uniref:Uncharacterized protein n=1 Tax=Uncinocarpus reesii (strain UAMH 1704) TaxID=336963 RepID=C4JJR8_UNCRE|nr:uncharacterized protein UREG_01875 [Uncinocarpus reesii 1704]EEP77026.1 predicted protein [Uncinocarpus reesii 1704]
MNPGLFAFDLAESCSGGKWKGDLALGLPSMGFAGQRHKRWVKHILKKRLTDAPLSCLVVEASGERGSPPSGGDPGL